MKISNKYGVGDGWLPLIKKAEGLVETYNKAHPDLEFPVVFTQIKEKWGELRLYLNYYPKELSDLIESIEEESSHICESCGTTENVETKEIHGWVFTLCSMCRQKELDEYLK